MAIYDISGNRLGGTPISVPLDHGGISDAGATTNSLTNIGITFRSAFPLAVEGGKKLTVAVGNDSAYVSTITAYEYTSAFAFVQKNTASSGTITLGSTTAYVRFVVVMSSSGHNPMELSVEGADSTVQNFLTRSNYEKFVFEVENDIYTSGVLMLPPNYVVSGKPVPLMVYIHGSNGYYEWDCDMGALFSGASYLTYIEYLRDEGFAILDVYGWTSKYKATADTQSSGNKSNTFITPITYRAFLAGIRYVLSRYNLDQNNVSLYCKSLGGGLANVFATKADIPIRAICELAPTIDSLFWGGWGQSVQGRTIIADQLTLTGNVESVFLQSNFDWRTTNGKAFIDANIDKIAGFNQGWNYNGQTLAEKLADSYSKTYTRTGYCREVLYPIKIWVAPDDTNISYAKITEFVAQCKNNSEDVTLRLMPENTGGHHSVDTDPNAPKSSGTTALGITYTDMPTAYVEMVEFIRSRA